MSLEGLARGGGPRSSRCVAAFLLSACANTWRADRRWQATSSERAQRAAPLRGVGRELARRRVCELGEGARLRRGPEVFAATSKLGPYQTKPVSPMQPEAKRARVPLHGRSVAEAVRPSAKGAGFSGIAAHVAERGHEKTARRAGRF
jgi:hypothetical protein